MMARRLVGVLAVLIGALLALPVAAEETDADARARAHFERGIQLTEDEAWDAALAEFLRSRELHASRGNTKNAALCLRKLHRFDEALEMYETLLREFPTLPAQDKTLAEQQIQELRALVGSIEISASESGAAVLLDGRERGTTPLAVPLRVSAGTHALKIYKQGFTPFETRVTVSGGQVVRISSVLKQLRRSGRLAVTERTGMVVDVVVDNVVVGKTPWTGQLAPGDHSVVLRGSGDLGTQPASVPVRVDSTATLALAVEPLPSELSVRPTPAGALIAVDGVGVGRGSWVGRLRSGTHVVEVAAEGFLAEKHQVRLRAAQKQTLEIRLERDPSSPLWRDLIPPRIFIELSAASAFGRSLGGDVDQECGSGCDRDLAIGGLALFRAGYEFSSGIGLALELGPMVLRHRIDSRASRLHPAGGLTPNPGRVDDEEKLIGVLAGASASLHRGAALTWTARLGGGVLLANLQDTRRGKFVTVTNTLPSGEPVEYQIGTITQKSAARYAYAYPEAGVGYRFGRHIEFGFSMRAMIFFALSQPSWDASEQVFTGNCNTVAPPNCASDGFARFAGESLLGSSFVLVSPALSARADF